MFTKITATILLLAFVSQTFAGPFIMLDYFMNKAAYTKNCVNKARPKMHCNGKCQAMKKILEEEKKEQQNAERKAAPKTPLLSFKSFFSLVVIPVRSTNKLFFYKSAASPVDRTFSVFHPPQV
jgi:hypothetical protein